MTHYDCYTDLVYREPIMVAILAVDGITEKALSFCKFEKARYSSTVFATASSNV